MTKKINWVEILEQNEEAILEAGRQAYRNSCLSSYDNSFSSTEDVVIDKDGGIRTETQQQNWQSMDTYHGNAICVISFKRFYVWENVEEETEIKTMLEPSELEEFQAYLDENEITSWGISTVRDWNSAIADRLDSKMGQYDYDAYVEEQVASQYEQCLERTKAEAEFSE